MNFSNPLANMFSQAPVAPVAPVAPAAPVAPVAPAQTLPTPGNLTPPAIPGNEPPPGVVTPDTAIKSPLDQFAGLWDTPKDDKGNEVVAETPNKFTPLDPDKLQELVGKASFTDKITPEIMASIAAGGEDAVKAFMSAINTSSQQVMVQSTLANNKLTEQAINNLIANQAASIPELLRKQAVTASNPLFSNPAVKPIMDTLTAQLAAKNPNSSAAEIVTMAENFVAVLGEQFNPTAAVLDPTQPTTDWDAYLN